MAGVLTVLEEQDISFPHGGNLRGHLPVQVRTTWEGRVVVKSDAAQRMREAGRGISYSPGGRQTPKNRATVPEHRVVHVCSAHPFQAASTAGLIIRRETPNKANKRTRHPMKASQVSDTAYHSISH